MLWNLFCVKHIEPVPFFFVYSETPIDKLSEDVKLGAKLIKELSKKLKQVEMEVRDAFKELEEDAKAE